MGDAEFRRVFEASPATRLYEWASLILFSCLIFIILWIACFFFVAFDLGILLIGMTPWWLPVAGVPLGVALTVGYLLSRSRCRFVLTLAENQVQTGPLCIAYDDVDQVSLNPHDFDVENRSSTAVEIVGAGKRICVQIGKRERMECAELLRQRCRNAVFVDSIGLEHLPTAPTDAARVAGVALIRFRKRALASMVVAVASAACVVLMLGVKFFGPRMHWFSLIAPIVFMGVILFGAMGQARGYLRKARRMQEALSQAEMQNNQKQVS